MEVGMVERLWVQEAIAEIERLEKIPGTRRLVDFKDQELNDILQREQDAFDKGYLQGIEQGKMEYKMVERMYANGIPIEKIVKYIGLPLEKVTEIIKPAQK